MKGANMSKINKSLGDYVECGFRVSTKDLSRSDWHRILHNVCHRICFGILADLPSAPADNKIFSYPDLWNEKFSYNTIGDEIPTAKSPEESGTLSIAEGTKLIPLVRLRIGEYRISYLLISPDGFAKWIKCTQRISRSRGTYNYKITRHPLSFAWMSEDELLKFIMKDPSIGFRIIATFNRLIERKISDEKQRTAKYLEYFENQLAIISEIQDRICL